MKYRISKRNNGTMADDIMYRGKCLKEKIPMVWIEPRQKYCSVAWDYKTKPDIDAMVLPYSLGYFERGPYSGCVHKVHIALGPELAEKIFDFLVG